MRFARELADDSPFAPREALGHKDARTLACELLGMTQEAFSAAFTGSPMKQAKLRGLKRNAAPWCSGTRATWRTSPPCGKLSTIPSRSYGSTPGGRSHGSKARLGRRHRPR
jgi:hypothetical protein